MKEEEEKGHAVYNGRTECCTFKSSETNFMVLRLTLCRMSGYFAGDCKNYFNLVEKFLRLVCFLELAFLLHVSFSQGIGNEILNEY